ncbi:hypothetical protein [Kozakia baliensis]|uniref:hypothetical protein n=1 Tax=Kozakia baliensis TaxID=153496 RepID=UPI00049780B1|nr:hypothetical protein [Kozakia baliensis]AOX19789.1 hypothetical protein A0U90_05245 [Kozakia baliensis]
MSKFRAILFASALSTLSACAGQRSGDLMQQRPTDTLLTSYMIANGMAERGMLARILAHKATRQDISLLIAVDHNTWLLIRQALINPSPENMRRADQGLEQVLSFATQVPQPASRTQ